MKSYLFNATVKSEYTLPAKFSEILVNHHIGGWKKECDGCIVTVMQHFQYFAQVTQNLVDRDFYATPQHRIFREELDEVLPEFESKLAAIQKDIPDSGRRYGRRRTKKKPKTTETFQAAETQAPRTSTRSQSSMAPAEGEESQTQSVMPDTSVQDE